MNRFLSDCFIDGITWFVIWNRNVNEEKNDIEPSKKNNKYRLDPQTSWTDEGKVMGGTNMSLTLLPHHVQARSVSCRAGRATTTWWSSLATWRPRAYSRSTGGTHTRSRYVRRSVAASPLWQTHLTKACDPQPSFKEFPIWCRHPRSIGHISKKARVFLPFILRRNQMFWSETWQPLRHFSQHGVTL